MSSTSGKVRIEMLGDLAQSANQSNSFLIQGRVCWIMFGHHRHHIQWKHHFPFDVRAEKESFSKVVKNNFTCGSMSFWVTIVLSYSVSACKQLLSRCEKKTKVLTLELLCHFSCKVCSFLRGLVNMNFKNDILVILPLVIDRKHNRKYCKVQTFVLGTWIVIWNTSYCARQTTFWAILDVTVWRCRCA